MSQLDDGYVIYVIYCRERHVNRKNRPSAW